MAQLTRLGRREPGLERCVTPCRRPARRVEYLHHLSAGHGEPGAEPLHTEGDGGDSGGVAGRHRSGAGQGEQPTRGFRPPRPVERVRFGHQQVDPGAVIDRYGRLAEGFAQSCQVGRSVGEGQRGLVRRRRGQRPSQSGLRGAARDRRCEVPGDLGRRDVADPGVARLECVCQSTVHVRDRRIGKRFDHRLAKEVVDEPRSVPTSGQDARLDRLDYRVVDCLPGHLESAGHDVRTGPVAEQCGGVDHGPGPR